MLRFGSGAFLPPGSGIGIRNGKQSDSESGMNIPDHSSERFKTIRWVKKILKFVDADPESFNFLNSESRMEKFGPGSGINIPDPQHCITHWKGDTALDTRVTIWYYRIME